MSQINLENVQNAIVGSKINTGGGDVLVGVNFYYSAPYQDMEKQLNKLQEHFAKTQQRIEKHPDDEDYKTELLEIDTERNALKNKIDDLKREVIRLAEDFMKIPINTERLMLARQHFETGDYPKARAFLDAEQMGNDQEALLAKKALQQQQLDETDTLLINNANEFLIKARLTAIDFSLPGRFEKTREYFEQSIKSAPTPENTFAYAYFLQKHNQFDNALPWYEEALSIRRRLAETKPETYLPDVALTLNHLGILWAYKNQFPEAEDYYKKALEIYRILAKANPHTYLPNVANTLNNLANLRKNMNQFPKAMVAYKKALRIYKPLAEANRQSYSPAVATIQNNLATLWADKNQFPEAEATYKKALNNYRTLAKVNPQAYLPDVALTLNNLAVLWRRTNQFPSAKKAYKEALEIYRNQANANPLTYQPHVACTLNNLANLRKDMNQFSSAKKAYKEALDIYRPLAMSNEPTYLPDVARTLNNLANLLADQNELLEAESTYEKSLDIYRNLAKTNPQTFLPVVAIAAMNISIFYLQVRTDREKSLDYAREALIAALPFRESLLSVQSIVSTVLAVIAEWGLDAEAFLEEIMHVEQSK